MTNTMEQMLRIAQIVNVRWFNATAWYGLALSRLLKEAGHSLRIFALPDTEAFAQARAMGFEATPLNLNTTNPLILARELRRLYLMLQEFRPHIVNCHRGEGMVFWGALKIMGHNFALVRTRGDQRPPRANLPNRYLHARLADAVIATNTRTARQCRLLLDVPEDRLHVIVGGVDTGRFCRNDDDKKLVRASLGFTPEDMVIGLLGRFDAVKGQRELLQAFRLLRNHTEGILPERAARLRLLLIGFPAAFSRRMMQTWIKEYGLEDCTVITDKVERPSAYINAMDLGVVASQGSETIARAALEIMSCAVPLVGTDVGVMPDLLPQWALAPPGDPSKLADLLKRAVNDVSFRKTLQETEQKRMEELSERSFLEQSMRAYLKALEHCKSKIL